MRLFLIASIMVLLAVPAHSQGTSQGMGSGKRHHKGEQQTDPQKKKKVDDKAYNDALSKIPASNEKPDPWRTMR